VKQDLVLWAGPVANYQVPGATVPGAKEVFLSCRGDQGPHVHCPSLGRSWVDAEGRALPQLLAVLGLTEEEVGDIYLGAFSAGGSTWKHVLKHPADRAKITALMLHDATYSGGSIKNPKPIEEFTKYALDVMSDPNKLFVATSSSSPNGTRGSADQVLAATRREIEERSGVAFRTGGSLPVPDQPLELHTSPNGNVIFATYGGIGGGHKHHPKMAPDFWKQVLQPWVKDRHAPPVPPVPPAPPVPVLPPLLSRPPAEPYMVVAALIVGGAIGYGTVLVVEKLAGEYA